MYQSMSIHSFFVLFCLGLWLMTTTGSPVDIWIMVRVVSLSIYLPLYCWAFYPISLELGLCISKACSSKTRAWAWEEFGWRQNITAAQFVLNLVWFFFSWIFSVFSFLVQTFVSYSAGFIKSWTQFKPTKNNGDQFLSWFIFVHSLSLFCVLLFFVVIIPYHPSLLFYVLCSNYKDNKAQVSDPSLIVVYCHI